MSRPMSVVLPKHPIRVWRDDNKISRAALCALLPSAPAEESIRHIETGHRPPGVELCLELQAVTGLEPKVLRDQRYYRVPVAGKARAA